MTKVICVSLLMSSTLSSDFKRLRKVLLYSIKRSHKLSILHLTGKKSCFNVLKGTFRVLIKLKEFMFCYIIFVRARNVIYLGTWYKFKH